MQFFRRLVRSKVGGFIALGFLLLMAFAFVSGDITGSGGLGVIGPSAGNVATVGRQTVTVNDLQSRTQRIFERFRQDRPELTMPQFLAQGGLNQVLDELITVKALIAYGEKHGIRISKKLIDAEIARIPAFADATGNFSESQFRAVLSQQRVSEKELRDDLAGQIIRQHLLQAAAAGSRTPESMVPPYSAMLIEQRVGEMLAIPSQAFAPTQPATEAQLRSYYSAHPDDFTLPEQRKLRYILIDRARFDAQAVPTEADIAAAYKSRAAEYAPRQSRTLSQLIVPTEAQARDLAAKAAGGATLGALASAAGLATTPIADVDQAQLAAQTNADTAKAAFAAAKGKIVGPVRLPLGWALLHVEDVKTSTGKSLEQARAELIPLLKADKAKTLFAKFVDDIDGKLGEGATLAEVAKTAGLQITETPLITGEGRALRNPEYQPDPALDPIVKQGFSMTAGDDPQVVQVKADEAVAVVTPGDIVPSGPPPFAEVRNAVDAAWKLSQGAQRARAAADKVIAALAKGVPVDEALKQAGVVNQPRQPLAVRRIELQQQQGRVPPAVQTLFTMRAGTAKLVPMENNLGYLVVRLEKIVPEDPRANAGLMNSTRAGLANVLGQEYAVQLIGAIQKELSVSRNAAAIASVDKALREANGAAAE